MEFENKKNRGKQVGERVESGLEPCSPGSAGTAGRCCVEGERFPGQEVRAIDENDLTMF